VAGNAPLRKFQCSLLAAAERTAPAFLNVYAYCRWADDLGDEIPSKERALELLDWWERGVRRLLRGRPAHPVFVALRETVVAKDIPKQPFADLLKAFRQDQVVKRYGTWKPSLILCVLGQIPLGGWCLYLMRLPG